MDRIKLDKISCHNQFGLSQNACIFQCLIGWTSPHRKTHLQLGHLFMLFSRQRMYGIDSSINNPCAQPHDHLHKLGKNVEDAGLLDIWEQWEG